MVNEFFTLMKKGVLYEGGLDIKPGGIVIKGTKSKVTVQNSVWFLRELVVFHEKYIVVINESCTLSQYLKVLCQVLQNGCCWQQKTVLITLIS